LVKTTSRKVERTDGWELRILWWIIASFTVAIPLAISVHGQEVFLLPKELLLRTEALLLIAGMSVSWIVEKKRFHLAGIDRLTTAVVLAIAAVTIITTLVSTNRAVSLASMVYTATCIVVFCAMYRAVAEIGNANDVGAYLAVCAIPLMAFTVLRRKRWNWPQSLPCTR
jgi:uncharacterized protein involved in response to NO